MQIVVRAPSILASRTQKGISSSLPPPAPPPRCSSSRPQVAATLFYGRWGLPVPFQTKLVTVVGTPIEVPPPSTWRRGVVEGGGDPAAAASLNSSRRRREEQEPPQELVDEVHARYVEELSALFHRHKWRIPGWEKRELVIT